MTLLLEEEVQNNTAAVICPHCRRLMTMMECTARIESAHYNYKHPQRSNKSQDDEDESYENTNFQSCFSNHVCCCCWQQQNFSNPYKKMYNYRAFLRPNHNSSLRPHRNTSGDSGPKTALKLFIWILLLFPLLSMSSPVPLQDEEAGPSSSSSVHKSKRHHDRSAKWINPCRIPSALPTFQLDMELQAQPDSELIANIITQVNKAALQSKRFMHNYYSETFGGDLRQRDKYADVHYEFLNDITEKVKKPLGAEMTKKELEELKLEDTLKLAYAGMQMFAVGLEQIVLDQSVYSGNFHKDFEATEYELKYLLCELQIGLLEKGIQYEDVTREIMKSDYRDIDCDTIRNIRDWVIFRDYINTLEYIQQTFAHFLSVVE